MSADIALVLLVALVAIAILGVMTGLRLGAARAPMADHGLVVQQAVAGAMADMQRAAAGQGEAAVRAALEHASVLNRDVVGHQLAAGQQELVAKKELIDSRLDQVRVELRGELARVSEMVQQLGSASTRSFGEVAAALNAHAELTAGLASSTQGLREALASTKTRGQWGERMAEDVLRLAGFVEHVNYEKQTSVEGGRALPDFTFPMPKGHVLYMDVKFPLSSYLRYLEATTDRERSATRDQFLRDARMRVRELSTRDYTAAGTASTVDYVLLFLPNESISSFIHEHDPALLDDALGQKVVLCSPMTLFALLGVIRQAFDNFMIEQTSEQILRTLGSFRKEWTKYTGSVDVVSRRLESLQRAFDDMSGTRRRQLDRSINTLDELRRQRGLMADEELALGAGDADPGDGENDAPLLSLRRRGAS
jgi:DNA recombination protein RmuC